MCSSASTAILYPFNVWMSEGEAEMERSLSFRKYWDMPFLEEKEFWVRKEEGAGRRKKWDGLV